jgi:glycosyltransferase involved in cell wall biosynthesis
VKIVVVCHEFTRMQRVRSLAEGLAEAGHEVVWVTSEAGVSDPRFTLVSVPYVSAGARAKRAVSVEPDANIAAVARRRGVALEHAVRFAASAYEAAFLYPDKYRGWIPAVRRWLDDSPREIAGADVVIASMMPVTTLVVGRLVADAAGAPLIVDFRDLWTRNAQYLLGPVRRGIDRITEKRILRDAAAVTTVTGHLQAELAPDRPDGVVHLVHTGVDPAPWRASRRVPDGVLRFGHVGVWMGGKRTIRPLLDSLRRLADRGEIDLDRVRIDMWGEIDEVVWRDARDTGTERILTFHGSIPMDDVPAALATVDVALVPTWPEDVWSIPLKTFQYLAAGKTILFIDSTPDSEMRRLVAGLPGVDFNDTQDELDANVARYYARIGAGDTLDFSVDDRPAPFTPRTMAEQFLAIIEQVAS